MRNLRHEPAGLDGRTDGWTDRLKHVTGEVTFFCILDARSRARSVRWSWVGRGRTELGGRGRSDITVLDGAALPIPIVVFSRHLFATTARRARARPSAIFRLPQGICSPIGGRVESQDGTGKQMGRAKDVLQTIRRRKVIQRSKKRRGERASGGNLPA